MPFHSRQRQTLARAVAFSMACISQALALAAPVKPTNAVCTSTRDVRDIAVAKDGAVWAATSGGVLRFDGKTWRKFTRLNGLPSHEALHVTASGTTVTVAFPTAQAQWDTRRQIWYARSVAVPRAAGDFLVTARWLGAKVVTDTESLYWNKKTIALPAGSSGTHISDLLEDGPQLLAALYGDGLWRLSRRASGVAWQREPNPPPATAREMTALAGTSKDLWVGTRRDGMFRRKGGKWVQYLQPNEPAQHNAQALLMLNGTLWMSTLEDGLVARAPIGWTHYGEPVLSSNAPRHLVDFRGALYVRHGGGMVDKYDGGRWTKNVFGTLPRKGIYALAADNERLFCAGWGGWSEWDSTTWTHRFNIEELRGIPLMALLPDGGRLWIATQSRGIGIWQRSDGAFKWLDERHGLRDDWVTALAQTGDTVYAGTFVDGLAQYNGETWTHFPQLAGDNVTALESDSDGQLWIGTRRGLWHLKDGALHKITCPWLDSEVQALAVTSKGLWVGTRTSLNFCTPASLVKALSSVQSAQVD